MKNNFPEMGSKIIKLLPKRTSKAIEGKAFVLGLKSNKSLPIHFKYNSDFAYFLGLIYSDGSLKGYRKASNDKLYLSHTITIRLKNDCSENKLLHDLRLQLGFGTIRYNKKNLNKNYGIEFVVTNKNLYHEIVSKFKLTTDKSANLCVPDIPDKYFPDFIRGFFDGDGSIYFLSPNPKNRDYLVLQTNFTSSSKKFLETILIKLRTLAKIKGGSVKADHNSYGITFGMYDSILLKTYMYNDENCLKLERKYNKFYEFAKNDKSSEKIKDLIYAS